MHRQHLVDLQQHRSYPSVTVLLPTTPGPRMTTLDCERLERMLAHVERRLTGDVAAEVRDEVVRRLLEQARRLIEEPVGQSLALMAAPGRSASHVLAVDVRERVVVDETFATRDLVHHVLRSVPVSVVTVSEQRVRLLTGTPDRLEEVGGPFPLEREEDEREPSWQRRCVAVCRAALPDPGALVVAGVERTARALATRLDLPVAGFVRGGHDRTGAGELRALATIHVEAYLMGQELEALHHLDTAAGQRLLVSGADERIDAVWEAVHDGRVAMLVAERGYEVPVRVMDGRPDPVTPEEVEDPDVVDDAVDELIEAVAARGGETVLVSDGALVGHGRLAAILRY